MQLSQSRSIQVTNPDRPTFLAAAFSMTSVCTVASSFVVAICMFLPHALDVRNDQITPAFAFWDTICYESELSIDGLATLTLFFWPYAFAMTTTVLFVVLVCSRPQWFEKALMGLPLVTAIAMGFAWTVLLFSGSSNSRMAMLIAALVASVGMPVLARVWWLWRTDEFIAVATWGTSFVCVLAMFSLGWFCFPRKIPLLLGGMLSIAAMVLMMLSSWLWIVRLRHDLFDRSAPCRLPNISLRKIMMLVAMIAIFFAYWRAIGQWRSALLTQAVSM